MTSVLSTHSCVLEPRNTNNLNKFEIVRWGDYIPDLPEWADPLSTRRILACCKALREEACQPIWPDRSQIVAIRFRLKLGLHMGL